MAQQPVFFTIYYVKVGERLPLRSNMSSIERENQCFMQRQLFVVQPLTQFSNENNVFGALWVKLQPLKWIFLVAVRGSLTFGAI